jgi:uncharacterized protein YndB with AHSA1/START domain
MAVRAAREIVIEASFEDILNVLADVDALPSWSTVHKHARVVDRYEDGRPHHARVAVKVLGLVDDKLLEYHWGPDWLVWDARRTAQHYSQHVEYTLRPDFGGEGGTVVRIEITVEPAALIPDFLIKRASQVVLLAATDGLRRWVLRDEAVGRAG